MLAIAPIVRVKSIMVFPPVDFILKDDYTLEVYLNIRINSSYPANKDKKMFTLSCLDTGLLIAHPLFRRLEIKNTLIKVSDESCNRSNACYSSNCKNKVHSSFPPVDFILKDDYILEVYLNIRINS
jgi:hypothetical protein